MPPLISTPTALRLLQALSFVWAGLVLGISFLETPVKFTAPTLTRAVGLDVGRHVFAALNTVEIGLGVLALGLLLGGGPGPPARWGLGGVLLILVLQTGWLLPILNRQAETIMQGGEGPAANYAHLGYIFLEVAKVAGLLVVGWCAAPS
jgi:hypothetical protein